jgi:hypothetical protein
VRRSIRSSLIWSARTSRRFGAASATSRLGGGGADPAGGEASGHGNIDCHGLAGPAAGTGTGGGTYSYSQHGPRSLASARSPHRSSSTQRVGTGETRGLGETIARVRHVPTTRTVECVVPSLIPSPDGRGSGAGECRPRTRAGAGGARARQGAPNPTRVEAARGATCQAYAPCAVSGRWRGRRALRSRGLASDCGAQSRSPSSRQRHVACRSGVARGMARRGRTRRRQRRSGRDGWSYIIICDAI